MLPFIINSDTLGALLFLEVLEMKVLPRFKTVKIRERYEKEINEHLREPIINWSFFWPLAYERFSDCLNTSDYCDLELSQNETKHGRTVLITVNIEDLEKC